ncbi:MAG: YebC/PmpR family DNA-binding transcriptional regulator [Oscillospiraceae bacterium]|nr:YebC/PmpR family DNA-binding transcriptional regulator [Oscillospiraceae bacterium]MBR2502929.1 YebC/PmpR family DNA-binding transcriptional regulator [Oscillospiraceae bacterium]
MSGHSKWSTIKRKKGANDAARAKVFTKLAREIAVAVKEGGTDPNNNSRLRDLLAKGRAANVPQDNLMRAIKKAEGDDKTNYESIVYEGYGHSGIAVIVECLSDNRNRTASNVRHYFDKFGGNLGTSGCVSFMFEEKGIIVCEEENVDEEKALEACMEAGANDVSFEDEGVIEFETDPSQVGNVATALREMGFNVTSAEASKVPNNYTKVEDEEALRKLALFFDALDEDDDVQNVYNNLENTEDLPEL